MKSTEKTIRHKGSSIKDVRTRGRRGLAKADACVNFACKRPNFAAVGGREGKKWQNGWPLRKNSTLDSRKYSVHSTSFHNGS